MATRSQKESTFATTIKGFEKQLREARMNLQKAEEAEFDAQRVQDYDKAQKTAFNSLEDIIMFAQNILDEAEAAKYVYETIK